MAIEYARIEFISRNKGRNACKVAAYNANCKVKDYCINQTFNFSNLNTNIYHEVLLPNHVDQKFKDIETLMNEVEQTEKRKDSTLLHQSLLHQYVIALPNDQEITVGHKIELIKRFVEKLELIKNNLAVVIDIHKTNTDTGELNWYGKLLVTTRRFAEGGQCFALKKARDLEFVVRQGKHKAFIPKSSIPNNGSMWKEVQNAYFEELDLPLRVDEVSIMPQERVGLRKYGILAELKRQDKQYRQQQ